MAVDLSTWPEEGQVAYTRTKGDVLGMIYDGEHRVNGQVIDYSTWKLYGASEAPAEMRSRSRCG